MAMNEAPVVEPVRFPPPEITLREHLDVVIARVVTMFQESQRAQGILFDQHIASVEAVHSLDSLRQDQNAALALTSQEKLTSAAFAAAKSAAEKAEQAQHEYNIRSNEFRGQLDDQAKTLIARTEVMVLIGGLSERINAADTDRQRKYEVIVAASAADRAAMLAEVATTRAAMAVDRAAATAAVAALRESKSNLDGRLMVLGLIGAAMIAVIVSIVSAGILSVIRGKPEPVPVVFTNPK